MSRNVLSIDWDFFTGDHNLNDNGTCSWHCHDCFGARSDEPKRPRILGHEKPRFTAIDRVLSAFRSNIRGAEFKVAECHASIYRLLEQGDRILNLDAHDDLADDRDGLSCGTWAQYAIDRKDCIYKHGYHHWTRQTFIKPRDKVDLVFVCQSAPWTPGEWDYRFYAFLRRLQKSVGREPQFVGNHARRLSREFVK